MLSAVVRATRQQRRRYVASGKLASVQVPLPEVNDLSHPKDAQQCAIYKLLIREWWPHLLHGPTRYAWTETQLVFGCPCGAQLTVTHEAAQQLGLL